MANNFNIEFLEKDISKIYNVNQNNLKEQVSFIKDYMKNFPSELNENLNEFKIQIIPVINSENTQSYWCGYIISNDNLKLKQILENNQLEWTYVKNGKIGIDCAHIDDINFCLGVNNTLKEIIETSQNCENKSYKTPYWILEQLRECIRNYNN